MFAQIHRRTQRWCVDVPAWAAVVLLLPSFGMVLADPGNAGATYARVRYLEGDVRIERDATADLDAVTTNSPVTPGDRVIVEGGRAEIELADGALVWLDHDSRIAFRTLADANSEFERITLLALENGAMRIEVPESDDPDAAVQVDTEAGSIYLLSAGTFRIETADGLTTLASLGGVAEFSGDGGSVLVRSGQRSAVEGGRSPGAPTRYNTQRQDDFDRFCVDRVRAYASEAADAVAGNEAVDLPDAVRPYAPELSYYGAWSRIPTYGLVWRPHYAGAWNPYLRGYWTSCPTGWVWVSFDPWGWAPYHYGRWDYAANFGWFWSPGAVWGGAWVSFAVGTSTIGWCPLNYYNRPVFRDAWAINQVEVSVGSLDARGWQFLSTGRFGWRGGPDTVIFRGDRLPRGTPLVVTRSLPQFDPRVIAKQPERAASLMDRVRRDRAASPAALQGEGTSRAFRTMERRSDRRPGTNRPRVTFTPAAVGTGRPSPSSPRDRPRATVPAPRPVSEPSAETHQQALVRPRSPAVERLVEGARPPAGERAAPKSPIAAKPVADPQPVPSRPPREEAKPGNNRRK